MYTDGLGFVTQSMTKKNLKYTSQPHYATPKTGGITGPVAMVGTEIIRKPTSTRSISSPMSPITRAKLEKQVADIKAGTDPYENYRQAQMKAAFAMEHPGFNAMEQPVKSAAAPPRSVQLPVVTPPSALVAQIAAIAAQYKKKLATSGVAGYEYGELDGLFSFVGDIVKKVGGAAQGLVKGAVDVVKKAAPYVAAGAALYYGGPAVLSALKMGGSTAADTTAQYTQQRTYEGASPQQIAGEIASMQQQVAPAPVPQQTNILDSLAQILAKVSGTPAAPPTYAQPVPQPYYQPQVQPQIIQMPTQSQQMQPTQAGSGLPNWVLPVSIAGGLGLLTVLLSRR